MLIGVTGATGFLGRYIVHHLARQGHRCRCWFRPASDRGGFDEVVQSIEWISGDLSDVSSMGSLVEGADAVVHAALDRPGRGFRGAEGNLPSFVECNVLGTIRLIEAAKHSGTRRFVFISTCAVHERILDDRRLDEAHPLWATTHYGAHKAAVEKFIHSYGFGERYDICALRPTGIYGEARPVEDSKWYDLVHAVKRGEPITSAHGGKEVHAADVAKAVGILLAADGIAGEAYNCFDRYIADQDVATIAKEMTGSASTIEMPNQGPKHEIETGKLRALGMTFGGRDLLAETIGRLLES
ncbi:MAG: NAD(P)-dependent oxidoreductase [Planctomycetes bacterium]|nr:NAD(P)-dependent oxidoreductase [Planctomycetota bacterium]